jgi:hypothetical protein
MRKQKTSDLLWKLLCDQDGMETVESAALAANVVDKFAHLKDAVS